VLVLALCVFVGGAGKSSEFVAVPPSVAERFAVPDTFSDGFESGDASKWTGILGTGAHFSQSGPHSGNWAGTQTVGVGGCCDKYFYRDFPEGVPDKAYYRAWYKFPTDFRWNSVNPPVKMMIWESEVQGGGRAYLNCDATSPTACIWRFSSSAQVVHNITQPMHMADGKWHSIELQMDSANQHVRAWFDGVLRLDADDICMGGDKVVEWKVGIYMNGQAPALDLIYVDDVAVSTQRIGP